ncbi:STAS domain-containing protein [Geodermatophilus sp. URMC 64]
MTATLDQPSGELITVSVAVSGSAARLTAAGEIDCSSAPHLMAELDRVLDAGVRELTIDLGGVTFLDSAGLCALAAAHRRATAEDVALRVLAANRAVIRPLQITGLYDLLRVETT